MATGEKWEADQARGLLSTIHGEHPDQPILEAAQMVEAKFAELRAEVERLKRKSMNTVESKR